jgi:hypothetical protein
MDHHNPSLPRLIADNTRPPKDHRRDPAAESAAIETGVTTKNNMEEGDEEEEARETGEEALGTEEEAEL